MCVDGEKANSMFDAINTGRGKIRVRAKMLRATPRVSICWMKKSENISIWLSKMVLTQQFCTGMLRLSKGKAKSV
jgi:hypothetical protein